MNTIDALKLYGPVYLTSVGTCKWKIQWVKPDVTVRPPNLKNLQKLINDDLAWAAYNRPANWFFITADPVIGRSWYFATNKPKVPSDALRENTEDMEVQAISASMRIFLLKEMTGDDPVHIGFRDACIAALKSSNDAGVNELLNRMRDNPLTGKTLEEMYKQWDDPKSPIRNFLLVRHIDFPEKTF